MAEPDDVHQESTPTLRVYITEHCPVCRASLRLVEKVRRKFSKIDVEVINLDAERAENIDGVFSVPTYVLDGRTLSLGNPDASVLHRKLSEALTRGEQG